jgi:hypothetical protein
MRLHLHRHLQQKEKKGRSADVEGTAKGRVGGGKTATVVRT